jgi:uncharacterized protein YbaR (Trm112 family)
MDPDYLKILICPKTKGTLRMATDEEIALVNGRIASGEIVGEDGVPKAPLAEGLTCPSAGLVYPIRDGIPVLLIDEAMSIAASTANPSSGE